MENLAGSGLEHYARFLEQAKRYRESLRDFLLSKYPGSPDHAFSQDMAMKAGEVAIDYEEIPKFEDRLIGVSEALASAAPDVLLLGLWSVVSFLAAYVAFLRCDIR
jgi:ABC-type transport system involved in multi-copper enzyme maturation permease subunit